MKKKVLFVIAALETGGAEKSLVNLLNLFDYGLYQVDLLLFKREGAFLEQLPTEVNLINGPEELHALYGQLKPQRAMEYVTNAKAVIRRGAGQYYKKIKYNNTRGLASQQRWHKLYRKFIPIFDPIYDVAIAYMHLDPLYFVAEKIKARKKIGWVHIDYQALDCDREIDFRYFEYFQNIVTISDECATSLRRTFPSIEGMFVNLPNLTSSKLLKELSERYEPSEYSSCFAACKILSIGRLSEQKGFDYAIDAAKILKSRGKIFCWYIIGQGELQKELEERIERNNVSDCVKLIGARSNPYPYIRCADIVVQSSRFEGKSVVLDEAKILAKPIIATNYSTVHNQILDGKEGKIVEISPEAIAGGIEALWEDSEYRNTLIQYLLNHNYDNAGEIKEYYKLMEG